MLYTALCDECLVTPGVRHCSKVVPPAWSVTWYRILFLRHLRGSFSSGLEVRRFAVLRKYAILSCCLHLPLQSELDIASLPLKTATTHAT